MANGQSVLSRIGQGLISFGSGVPQVEIDKRRSQAQLAQQDVQLQEQDLEANQRALEKDQRREILTGEAFGGGPESTKAMARLAIEFPETLENISKSSGIITQGEKDEAADFATRLKATPFDQRQPLIDKRVQDLVSATRDPQHTSSLTGLSEEDQNNAATVFEVLALSPQQRLTAAKGGLTSESRTSAERARVGGFSEEEIQQAARVEAGLRAREGLSAAERIAEDATLTKKVAESGAVIEGAKQTAKTEAKLTAELARAEEVGGAAARQALLVEQAKLGARIAADRIKTAEEARVLLPDAEAGAAEMVALLNEIRNDPELENVLGSLEGRVDFRFSEAQNELLGKIAQVTGKTFLQAYQSLKGGGPITDTEGKAATEAQSRLTNRKVSVEAYQGAIDELVGITDSRLGRLRRKAGPAQAAPEGVGRFQIEVVQ